MSLNRAIRIGSRKSDLARLQAMLVGDLLRKRGHSVEFIFKEAPGDINLSNPLWQMPEVGVFTSFLHEYLLKDEVDVVVHSWKDLPIDPHPGAEVVASLPREDSRDLLLVRKDVTDRKNLVVLTSSPRRQHNLKDFLSHAVPGVSSVEFKDVRGNIQTRMNKLCDPKRQEGANALIVAKAAVDRFLSAEHSDFQVARETVRNTLNSCQWAVLPLSVNPTAAAQGALALEISSSAGAELRNAITALNDAETFNACTLERETLKKYGGGCHQKIGCSVLNRKYGNIFSVRGLQPDGVAIDDFKILTPPLRLNVAPGKIGSVGGKSGVQWFSRENLEASINLSNSTGLFVAKADALPNMPVPLDVAVWTAGVDSWLRLAARGIWVNGCSDRLGEGEGFGIDLIDKPRSWIKVTHDKTVGDSWMEIVPTYRLVERDDAVIPKEWTHVYWASGSAFEAAVARDLEISSRVTHGCGPGHTFDALAKKIPREKIILALSFEEFRKKCSS